jgi:glutathione synthase/RimK-type ligase-like ATP-grasp enzyme
MEPQVRIGLAPLTKLAFDGQPLDQIRNALAAEFARNPQNAATLMDLSVIEQLGGNLQGGLELQAHALKSQRLFTPYNDRDTDLTVLVLAAPIDMGGNTPVEFLLEDRMVRILTYYIDPNAPMHAALPPHDVAFVATPGDYGPNRAFLKAAEEIAADLKTPVVNDPRHIAKLERDVLAPLLMTLPGVRCPRARRFDRSALELAVAMQMEPKALGVVGAFPLIIRPVGSHAGKGLERLDRPGDLARYLAQQSAPDFFVSDYIDYRTRSDGKFRKYRIILVDGQPFPCHMAIADDWKVWYLNAEMQNSAAKRAEEEDFMRAFDGDFARRHADSLEALHHAIGLDYFGIDCAEDEDGTLVLFEADNALIAHNMDGPEVFPYKDAHMRRLFDAFEKMLRMKATHAQPSLTPIKQRPLQKNPLRKAG